MQVDREEAEKKARSMVYRMRELLTDPRGHRARVMKESFDNWRKNPRLDPNPSGSPDQAIAHFVAHAERGDPFARKACFMAAAEFLSDGIAVPPALGRYIAGYCQKAVKKPPGGGKKGKSRYDNFDRDFAIETAIYLLRNTCEGLSPTRGETKRQMEQGVSACSILADILPEIGVQISEAGLEKVWNRVRKQMKQRAFP
jgi:hypothetical protein